MSKGIKHIACTMVVFSSLIMACSQKENIMTKQEIKAKSDSIVASKTAELKQEAAEDLDRRKSIEVKAKADSIVEAWQAKQPKESAQ